MRQNKVITIFRLKKLLMLHLVDKLKTWFGEFFRLVMCFLLPNVSLILKTWFGEFFLMFGHLQNRFSEMWIWPSKRELLRSSNLELSSQSKLSSSY
jgi:hypothetical protein